MLAFNFNLSYVDNSSDIYSYDTLGRYLTVIQTLVSVRCLIAVHFLSNMTGQDFGDDGRLYQHQLNHATRYIMEHPRENEPDTISGLQKNHNITAILAQIASEKAGELAQQRTDETGRGPTTLVVPHISRTSQEDREVAEAVESAGRLSYHSEADRTNRAAVCDGKMKAILRCILKLGRKKDTVLPSNKLAGGAVASAQERRK